MKKWTSKLKGVIKKEGEEEEEEKHQSCNSIS